MHVDKKDKSQLPLLSLSLSFAERSQLAYSRIYFEPQSQPVPNCSYKVYQFVKQPMLLHLSGSGSGFGLPASVRFTLVFCFLCLFSAFCEILLCVLLQQPDRRADGLTGRRADRQAGNLLVAGSVSYLFVACASCSNASSLPQLPSYWQWLNVARLSVASRRIAARLLCSLRDCVYLRFICLCLPLHSHSHVAWCARSSGVFLLCYACRSTIAPLIALISDLK